MMQAREHLLSLGPICTLSPGKGVDRAPDLGRKGLALQQVTEYNLSILKMELNWKAAK